MDASQICGMLDADLVGFIHNIIVLLKIAVPIVLIILGMLDLFKGVISSKEDEIKKGQQIFIKRLIAGVLVFLVVTIVQLVMGFISKEDGSFWECADAIMNGDTTRFQYYDPEDTSKCKSPIAGINEEYEHCLTVAGNQICNTVFQHDCKVEDSTMIWEYNSSSTDYYSISSKYSCKSGLGNYDNIYQRALYSCSKDEKNGLSLEECASRLGSFCKSEE